MKLFGALLITLSSITPASSIFIIAPGVVQQAGTGAFISFFIGALVSLLTAYVYAELSSAFPLTGGEYTIVGRLLGPFPGFIILGVNLITLILIVAVIALGIGNYVEVVFPSVSPVTAGLVTVLITTLSAILNIRTNALITGAFLLLELIALVVLTTLGFWHIHRPFFDTALHPLMLVNGAMVPTSLTALGLATSVAVFVYNGYGNAVYLGEETHDPRKQIARAIIWSFVIGAIAEIIPITAVLMGAPDLKELISSPTMFSDLIANLGGKNLNILLSLGVALAILNANIAFVVLVARLLYSTGRDHVWPRPINYGLTRLHKKFGSPWIATLVCGALSAAACFIDLNLLLVITGTSLVIIYAALCLAVLAGRKSGKTAHGSYKMPFYPWPPLLALVVLIYIVYANFLDPVVGRPSLWAALGMILLSAAYYFLVLRRKGLWVLRGPDE